jgi:hypothetical protein
MGLHQSSLTLRSDSRQSLSSNSSQAQKIIKKALSKISLKSEFKMNLIRASNEAAVVSTPQSNGMHLRDMTMNSQITDESSALTPSSNKF